MGSYAFSTGGCPFHFCWRCFRIDVETKKYGLYYFVNPLAGRADLFPRHTHLWLSITPLCPFHFVDLVTPLVAALNLMLCSMRFRFCGLIAARNILAADTSARSSEIDWSSLKLAATRQPSIREGQSPGPRLTLRGQFLPAATCEILMGEDASRSV